MLQENVVIEVERRHETGKNASNRLRERDRIPAVIYGGGTGMADEILERAGEVFFTTKPQGNGLGLANSRQMLASMGGELHLESVPGQGTKAQLILPQKQVEVKT